MGEDTNMNTTTWRDIVNMLVDTLGITRYSAEEIVKAALKEGYRYA
jgi:hypothetical protein